jgi:hypothetical protein
MQGGYKRASRHHPGSNRFLKRDDVAGPGGAAVINGQRLFRACACTLRSAFRLGWRRGRN